MFQAGDKIVHPMYGAGIVERILEEKNKGVVQRYYVLKLPSQSMVLMIPTKHSEQIGVRPVIDREQADRILSALPNLETDMQPNWNRRFRENQERLKSGDLMEVARVIKGLMRREAGRGLSTGERKMLHMAKQILISELVLAKDEDYQEMEKQVDLALV